MTKLAGDLAERRKHSRLPLSFGVIVRIRERTGWRELNGFSENLGSRGILFATDGQIKSGSKVEIGLTLAHHPAGKLSLFCRGEVMRVEKRVDGHKLAVAVRCDGELRLPSA